MQIKFLSIATLAFFFATVSTAPTAPNTLPNEPEAPSKPGQNGDPQVLGSGNEATFNAKVAAIQKDPEVVNTLDFLIQQIAAKLNEGPN